MTDMKWRRATLPDGTPHYVAEVDGVQVAEVSMTGRRGVDDYPWDWSIEFTTSGRYGSRVSDTLRNAKEQVELAWARRIEPTRDELVTAVTALAYEQDPALAPARKKLKVRVTVTVEVDRDLWDLTYGKTPVDVIREDVKSAFLTDGIFAPDSGAEIVDAR